MGGMDERRLDVILCLHFGPGHGFSHAWAGPLEMEGRVKLAGLPSAGDEVAFGGIPLPVTKITHVALLENTPMEEGDPIAYVDLATERLLHLSTAEKDAWHDRVCLCVTALEEAATDAENAEGQAMLNACSASAPRKARRSGPRRPDRQSLAAGRTRAERADRPSA